MSLRSMVGGVTWKNPVVSAVVHTIDPIDSIVRRIKGLGHLPAYSIRVRSNGIRQDIGGEAFVLVGRRIGSLLRKYAALTPNSEVLEIGCGCGRNALALAEVLDDGNYIGMDIERVALEAARDNSALRRKQFRFEFLDIRNDAYNPHGRHLATEYILPYGDKSFDIVFLISVFTHMLTEEVMNYAKEISRVLKPGGRCFLTAYLLDKKMELQFPYTVQEHCFANESVPGIAVAYRFGFISSTFATNGMIPSAGPLWGSVHGSSSETELDQDLIVFEKR